jgi:hypothetical protein
MDNQLAPSFVLLSAPHAALDSVFTIVARLAPEYPLTILDCGNRFNVFPLAQKIREVTPNVHCALINIALARAFTCYQVVALLSGLPATTENVIVMDLLSTFKDENVPFRERRRLLENAVSQLQRLSVQAPVLVTTKTVTMNADAERIELAHVLEEGAHRSYTIENPRLNAAEISRLWPPRGV